MKKPPLGITPKEIWREKEYESRRNHIWDAMIRYHASYTPIPKGWSEEHEFLTNEINKIRR